MVMAVFSAGETRVEAASSRTLPSRSRRVALGQGLDGQMIDVHRVLLRAGALFVSRIWIVRIAERPLETGDSID